MRKRGLSSLVAALVLLAASGCNSREAPAVAPAGEAPVVPAAVPESAAAYATNNSPAAGIAVARTQLKAGNVEEAAAQLARLQAQGASFNAQQAKDYRQALSEAYDRAIEAAQRGDPKGQAAIQLLRAAAPR
jgi:hypothetical protein